MEIDMMRIDPGAIGFTRGFSLERKHTVREQITIEQLIEKRKVMIVGVKTGRSRVGGPELCV